MTKKKVKLNNKFLLALKDFNNTILEQEEENLVYFVGMIAGHSVHFVGPPGCGKTFRAEYGAAMFTPDKDFEFFFFACWPTMNEGHLIGSIDPAKLAQGVFQRNIENTLLTATFAMLDENFNGNDSALMGIQVPMERKVFREQGRVHQMPLRFLVTASNHLPDEERLKTLGAYWDRAVLRVMSGQLQEQSNRTKMRENYRNNGKRPLPTINFTVAELDQAQSEAAQITISEEVDALFDEKIVMALKQEGLAITNRKQNQCQDVMKAHAWLYGRTEVTSSDFMILRHVLWDDPKHIPVIARIVLDAVNPIMRESQEIFDDIVSVYNKTIAGNIKEDAPEFLQKAKQMAVKIKTLGTTLPEGNDKDVIRGFLKRSTEMINDVDRASRGGDVDLDI